MRQDIYDLTVAISWKTRKSFIGWPIVMYRTGTALWMWFRIPYARRWRNAGDSETRLQ